MLITLSWFPSYRRYRVASKTDPKSELSDQQWTLIARLFPWTDPTRRGGRPVVPPRPCLDRILWILRTGAQWKDLPRCFPSPATCWRRLRDWTKAGLFQKAWALGLRTLDGQGKIDWSEAIADGTFAKAKKGAKASETPSAARARRSWP
ncbi:MAG: transposase [Planctomycetota bacterium]|nr:MAG: transposase [Planctomycetota bacterium]